MLDPLIRGELLSVVWLKWFDPSGVFQILALGPRSDGTPLAVHLDHLPGPLNLGRLLGLSHDGMGGFEDPERAIVGRRSSGRRLPPEPPCSRSRSGGHRARSAPHPSPRSPPRDNDIASSWRNACSRRTSTTRPRSCTRLRSRVHRSTRRTRWRTPLRRRDRRWPSRRKRWRSSERRRRFRLLLRASRPAHVERSRARWSAARVLCPSWRRSREPFAARRDVPGEALRRKRG